MPSKPDPAAARRPPEPPPILDLPPNYRREKLTPEREKRLLDLHVAHCPRCAFELFAVEAEGVEAELCEDCEALWVSKAALSTLVGFPPERRKTFMESVFGPTDASTLPPSQQLPK